MANTSLILHSLDNFYFGFVINILNLFLNVAYVSYSRFLEMIDYNIQNIHFRIVFGKNEYYIQVHTKSEDKVLFIGQLSVWAE